MTIDALLRKLVREAVQEELRTSRPPPVTPSTPPPSSDSDWPLTTSAAARYCGFKAGSAIRKAFLEGRLRPVGRRGGTGTYMWSRAALDAFLAGERGAFRSRSVLDKPFREIATTIGLGKHATPRAMRRTYQDLARAAEMRDLVTRAISGHATEQMQQHYSTVAQAEMREGIAKIISLAGVREALARAGGMEVVWGGDETKKAS